MKEYFVYIVKCSDQSFYTGVTNNYNTRIDQHQQGINPKCYTFKRRPIELVYTSMFHDIRDAISWEKQIKKWGRKKKMALIQGEWDSLKKLSECKNDTHHMLLDSSLDFARDDK